MRQQHPTYITAALSAIATIFVFCLPIYAADQGELKRYFGGGEPTAPREPFHGPDLAIATAVIGNDNRSVTLQHNIVRQVPFQVTIHNVGNTIWGYRAQLRAEIFESSAESYRTSRRTVQSINNPIPGGIQRGVRRVISGKFQLGTRDRPDQWGGAASGAHMYQPIIQPGIWYTIRFTIDSADDGQSTNNNRYFAFITDEHGRFVQSWGGF